MSRREDGFTLVELLVAITVLGVIAPVMVSAIVLGLKTTAATTGQLNASHSRQELAALFTTDVQSAVTVADETSTDTTTCMSAAETLVGRLSWTDIDSSGASTARVLTYAIVTVAGDKQLVRHACTGAAMSTVTVVHNVVSGNLDCTSTAFATVACATAAGAKLTAADASGSWVVEGLTR